MTSKHMKLPIKLDREAQLPEFAHATDAGMDLRSSEFNDIALHPGKRVLVDTGVQIAVPVGHVGLIMDKSGRAIKEGLTVLGGVIDSGYRGNIQVILYNTGDEVVFISQGQKIAQLVVMPLSPVVPELTDQLPPAQDERGEGGFGSTGL